MCGTVFPINRRSSTGLLILNPGHIDPGFNGPISICAINLSNQPIVLNLKDDIFTILFEELDAPTDSYKDGVFGDRIEYEKNFYENKASRLSPGLFDLIAINEHIPYLRDQVSHVLKEERKKIAIQLAKFLGLIGVIWGLFAGVMAFKEDKKIEELSNQIETLKGEKTQVNDELSDSKDSIDSLNNIINDADSSGL